MPEPNDPDNPEWPYGITEGWIDLGQGHMIRPLVNHDEEPCGFIEAHRDITGAWCSGYLARRGKGMEGRPEWDVETEDPLTLHPSVWCNPEKGGCGNHGWVRDGKWEAA